MVNKFIELRSSVYSEINAHFRLVSANQKSFLYYFSSPYRITLIIIFTILFLPHVFVVVRDINFVTAYEVDPGSIIKSIMSLYANSYNMNSAYHSRYYGWTYYSINYFLLMPIYFAKTLKIVADDYYFFVGIRFIFFFIGLCSVLAYFEIAKRFLKHTFLSFTAALLYIASPAVFSYFYFIHPESTGLLFLFLAILCLLNFNDGKAKNMRWYTWGLVCLVLSALSKHFFFITALPVLFLFCFIYCYYNHIYIGEFVFSKKFIRTLFLSTILSLAVFFFINPFAFFQPKVFITNQVLLFSTQTQDSISSVDGIMQWINIIKTLPVIYLSIILIPITLSAAIFLEGTEKVGRTFYIVNIIGSLIFVIILSISMRYIIDVTYLSHIYPFFVLNIISIALYIVRRWSANIIKLFVMIPLAYFLFFVVVVDFSVSLPKGYTRLAYQDSSIYKVYTYIEENIPNGSKIAHDHHVAIPYDKEIIGCHFWGCGTDYLEEFQPDYVIFDENWIFSGEIFPGTVQLKKFVSDHNFILIDTIDSVSIWKK